MFRWVMVPNAILHDGRSDVCYPTTIPKCVGFSIEKPILMCTVDTMIIPPLFVDRNLT